MTRDRIRDSRFLCAIISIVASVGCAPTLHAQNCSRNMLTIVSSGSYVATPGVSALNLTEGFTIECWVKVNTAPAGAALVDKGDYGIYFNNDSILYGSVRHASPFQVFTPAVDSPANWHHIAFVFTPNDSLRFYVDTIEVSSVIAPFASIDSTTDSLRIGMSWTNIGFTGSLDELRIWDLPRSLAEIEQTLYQTIPGTDSGLVLYYSFDDPTGSHRVHDFSGHGRDGFIRGPNAEIIPSTSPITNGSPGYALATVEKNMILPTLRCATSFDTVVHVRNLGPDSVYVDTVGVHPGISFSIVPNGSFWLPPDSNSIDSLRIHFEPDEGGIFDDSLYISSSSICGGIIGIGLHASYDSVGLLSSPDTVNFGALTPCELPSVQSIRLTNTSVIDSVTILNSLPPSDSSVHVLNTFPIALGPHQDTVITVQLGAGKRGPVSTALGFELDKCSSEAIVMVTADREAAGLSLPSTIDFGSAPSMVAGVSRDTVIVVTNTGDVADEIVSIHLQPDSIVTILDGRSDVPVEPGDTLQVHVQMHASKCGITTGALVLTSYACTLENSTSLSITLTPPMALTTPDVNMGILCVPEDTTIYVTNPNDIPVVLDTITFSKNSIFENSPFFPDTIPAFGSIPIQLRFDPAGTIAFEDTAYLQMSPCGVGTTIFKGQLGFEGISFSATQLLFGRGCETDSISELDTITNLTSDTVAFGTNSYSGSLQFSVAPFPFPVILPPGGSQAIWVTYSPVLGELDTGTFSLLTFDGCTAAAFHLRGSREIAKAVWADSVAAFDTICIGTGKDRTIALTDLGIDSIDVMSASVTGTGFSLQGSPSTFGTNGNFTVRFSPTEYSDYFGLLTVVVDSCGTTFSLPLHGTGGPAPEMVLSTAMLDFDSILVGDSTTYCIAITNPSCQPVTAQLDTSNIAGSPFSIVQMPDLTQLASGDTAYLCVKFRPGTFGNFSGSLAMLGDSIASRTISLSGVGLAPDVVFRQHLRDFGYVLANSSETLMINDSNLGNLASAITALHDSPVFVVQPPDPLAPLMGDSIAVTFNPVPGTGLVYDTVHFLWDGHTDSVMLRGFGTESGLQVSAVGLDFGNVHVGSDSTLPLYLFATNDFPTIDSVSIYWVNPAPRDTFFDTASDALPYTIQNAQDTLTLQVTYHAVLKQYDTGYLVIHTGTDSAIVSLTARGVDALPSVTPDSILFPPVVIGTSMQSQPVQIKNSGSYPLYIDSIFTSDPTFVASAIAPSEAILPDSTRLDTVTFTPVRTRPVTATLSFLTSYHDSVIIVQLSGSGMYSTQFGPSFGYSIDTSVEEPGENDSIPITMNGIRLSQIDDDSLILDIRFDPQMVMVSGADGGTKANPAHFTPIDDSTVEASIPMTNFIGGTVMRLYTQALLGPHDTSYIRIIDSTSDPLADLPSNVGEFIVEDCGGPVQGVVFAGPYATNAIVPNPASDNASLAFQIGWNAPVTLDFYNAIGQNVKHLDAGTLSTGSHTLTLDVSGLPEGRYVYRIRSLDYSAEGALVILR